MEKVSVVIVTYNSEKYIIELLESIKNQSILPYEIIIADDSSEDNTIKKIEEWSIKNLQLNLKITKSNKNEGVSKNLNRGLKLAKSKWIKTIGGDDVLAKNCLKDNLEYLKENRNAEIIFSDTILFLEEFKIKKLQILMNQMSEIQFFNLNTQEKYKKMLKVNVIKAPTLFIKKSLLEEFSYFPEEYIVEDYPMWLILLKNKVNINYFPKTTVFYRKHPNSLNTKKNKNALKRLIPYYEQMYNNFIKKEEKNIIYRLSYLLFIKSRKAYLNNYFILSLLLNILNVKNVILLIQNKYYCIKYKKRKKQIEDMRRKVIKENFDIIGLG